MVEESLEKMAKWAEDYGLDFRVNKCQYTMFPVKGQIGRRPTIKIRGSHIKYCKEIKYLGVLIDHKLTWLPHLNGVMERVKKFENKLKQFTRATWGLRPEVLKTLYLRATERLVLYGAPNWVAQTERVRTKLIQIQRRSLLGISKCYRTVSSDALQVLTGCVSLDLIATAEKKKHALFNWNEEILCGDVVLNKDSCFTKVREFVALWRCVKIAWDDKLVVYGWYAFTDGAKRDDKVGCALG